MPYREIATLSVRITASEEEMIGPREETAVAGLSSKPIAEPDVDKLNGNKAD